MTTIRPAIASDAKAIHALVNEHAKKQLLLDRPLEEIVEEIDDFLVAEKDGKVIGCCQLDVYNTKLAELRSLAVKDEHKGMGAGKALVEEALSHAKDKGVTEVMAITSEDEFFKKLGFGYATPTQRRALFAKP
ncbi:hypothetical protein AUJ14_03660 [Candidatus Micrarchaeota archaeon CG1_02_55_22]|nr:MAG: hypothetical protein AUJ14_03660 [Candidatus Micrarchaeota archaeon CG1_02_55_22]